MQTLTCFVYVTEISAQGFVLFNRKQMLAGMKRFLHRLAHAWYDALTILACLSMHGFVDTAFILRIGKQLPRKREEKGI